MALVAPRPSLGQLAAASVVVSLSWFIYRIYASMRVPKALASVQPVSIFDFFKTLLVPFPTRHRFFKDVIEKSKLLRVWLFGRWTLQIVDADLAKQVFTRTDIFQKAIPGEFSGKGSIQSYFFGENIVFSNGEGWKKHRRIVNPAFKRQWDTDLFADVTLRMMEEWTLQNQNKDLVIDVHEWMQKMTLDALGLSIFNYDFHAIKGGENPLLETYHKAVGAFGKPLLFLFPKLGTLLGRKEIVAMQRFNVLMMDLIQKRKQEVEAAHGSDREFRDLISLMIKAAYEDGDAASLTVAELSNNAFIFFIAGHDTTANSLACIMYYLSKYPHIQDKVRQEIYEVVGKPTGKSNTAFPSFEEQKRLNYMTAVIFETLRLCPSVPSLPFRKTVKETKLGDIDLPVGSLLAVNIFAINRSPKLWTRPDDFDPSRFDYENLGSHDALSEEHSETQANQHPFAWIPFGGGSRSCIGQTFSLIEQRLVLSMILSRYQIELPEGSPHKDEIQFKLGALAAPVKLELRFVPLL